jgi:hypothetical protein
MVNCHGQGNDSNGQQVKFGELQGAPVILDSGLFNGGGHYANPPLAPMVIFAQQNFGRLRPCLPFQKLAGYVLQGGSGTRCNSNYCREMPAVKVSNYLGLVTNFDDYKNVLSAQRALWQWAEPGFNVNIHSPWNLSPML